MRVLEVQELRGPHLVLADVGDPDGGRVGVLAELLHHPLRCERAIGRLGVRHRVLVAPTVDRGPPRLQIRLAVLGLQLFDLRDQVVQHRGHIADNRHVGHAVLADLRRVDIDVDDARGRRERVEFAGHAVVEASADGDE